jgi:protein O-GlcNAc transferase
MAKNTTRYSNPFIKARQSTSKDQPLLLNLKKAIDLHQQGKIEQAESIYREIISTHPNQPDAYHFLGIIAYQKREFSSAVDMIEIAIKFNPNVAGYYTNLGNSLRELKQLNASLANYDKAIALKPDSAEPHSNRGNILRDLKQLDDAVASYDKAIALKPDFADAYSNRGNTLRDLKKIEAAIASYDKAIALNPNFADAHCNRGNALRDIDQFDNAITSYDRAIEIKPNFAEAYSNRGNSLRDLKKLDAAIASYDKAFELNPELPFIQGVRHQTKMLICQWESLSTDLSMCKAGILKNKNAATPFVTLISYDSPQLHLTSAKNYVATKCPPDYSLGILKRRQLDSRLKIGYYSADLYYHPVSIWLAQLLEKHDKSKFELFGFSLKTNQDPMRDRLRSSFDHLIEVGNMSDIEVTRLSRELNIDIAIDLNGHTSNGRPGIFAARAAPIQISYLGYPGTTGAEYIDYFITDENTIPERSRQYCTEKIAYVPCVYTYDRQREVSSELLTRSQFGLPDNAFVFTCQNGCQKITPDVFDIWMDLLKTVPHSVLWLLEPHPTAVQNLRKEALARGVQSERLIFTKRETVPNDQEMARIGRYLASYKLADLFLDTWPYNAGTTAVDALWAGLPVLTKSGESVVARMATSALHAIEVPELITTTPQEYRELAIELAINPQRLKEIKEKIERNRLTTALFDPVANTKHIEAAYLEMYRRYQKDLPLDHIFIEG